MTEKYAKTVFLRLCSIFSNGCHVFYLITAKNTNLVTNIPKVRYTKFEANRFSSFREEDFLKKCSKYIENWSKMAAILKMAARTIFLMPPFNSGGLVYP